MSTEFFGPFQVPEHREYFKTPIMIGADPEVFLLDRKGRPVAPPFETEGVLNKYKRIYFPGYGEISQDGLAMEFNVEPVELFNEGADEELWKRIQFLLKKIEEMAGDYGYAVEITPQVGFNKKYYDSLPESLKELGCNPDILLYRGVKNSPFKERGYSIHENTPPKPSRFRYAGGHIHLGWTEGWDPSDPWHVLNASCIVSFFRISRVCTFISRLDENTKPAPYNNMRLYTSYANPVACRIKTYGVELRAPSNQWIAQKEYVTHIIERLRRFFGMELRK